ncbi:hypothetical protein FCM35_KLT19759 [Carex littledalei]|uniref:Uncharacterized protein n=1 Tax=Carex littledalei TaxID=544730 RepID=A0A833R6J9_9POAL|nr:hypothetical protein FCM35_KLT19759 [Carex littledalei]
MQVLERDIEEANNEKSVAELKIEGHLRLVKNEVKKHRATCAAETKKMTEYLAKEENQLNSVENEAQEFLKSAETKLRDAVRLAEEETQLCASEVIAVIYGFCNQIQEIHGVDD